MAKRPVMFTPTMYAPEGLNNYPGTVFRCFTVGDTLPFEFTINAADGSTLDVTGWSVKIVIATSFDAASALIVTIPLFNLEDRVFKGAITDEQTATLTPGINKALAKFVTATGEEYIIDMCILEIYDNIHVSLIP